MIRMKQKLHALMHVAFRINKKKTELRRPDVNRIPDNEWTFFVGAVVQVGLLFELVLAWFCKSV